MKSSPFHRRYSRQALALILDAWRVCISTHHRWTHWNDTSFDSACNAILTEIAQVNLNQFPGPHNTKMGSFPGLWSVKSQCAPEISFHWISLPEQLSIDEIRQWNQTQFRGRNSAWTSQFNHCVLILARRSNESNVMTVILMRCTLCLWSSGFGLCDHWFSAEIQPRQELTSEIPWSVAIDCFAILRILSGEYWVENIETSNYDSRIGEFRQQCAH
jgi:hypothetical protein